MREAAAIFGNAAAILKNECSPRVTVRRPDRRVAQDSASLALASRCISARTLFPLNVAWIFVAARVSSSLAASRSRRALFPLNVAWISSPLLLRERNRRRRLELERRGARVHRLHVPRILAAVITVERHADGVRRERPHRRLGVARAAFRFGERRVEARRHRRFALRVRSRRVRSSRRPRRRLVPPKHAAFPPPTSRVRPRAESHARAPRRPSPPRAERLGGRAKGVALGDAFFVRRATLCALRLPTVRFGPAVNLVLRPTRERARAPTPRPLGTAPSAPSPARPPRASPEPSRRRARAFASASREPPRGRARAFVARRGGGGFPVRLRRFKRVRGGTLRRRALGLPGLRRPPPLREPRLVLSSASRESAPPRVAPSPPPPSPPSSPSRSPPSPRAPSIRATSASSDRSDAKRSSRASASAGSGPRARSPRARGAVQRSHQEPRGGRVLARSRGAARAEGESARRGASRSCGETGRRRRRRKDPLLRRRRRGRVEEGGAERRRVVRGGVPSRATSVAAVKHPSLVASRAAAAAPPCAARTNPPSVVPGTSRRAIAAEGSAGEGEGWSARTIASTRSSSPALASGSRVESSARAPRAGGTPSGPGRGCETRGASSPRPRRDAPHRATNRSRRRTNRNRARGRSKPPHSRASVVWVGTFAAGSAPSAAGKSAVSVNEAPRDGAPPPFSSTETADAAAAAAAFRSASAFSALSSAAACASRTRAALSSAETGADVPSANEPPGVPLVVPGVLRVRVRRRSRSRSRSRSRGRGRSRRGTVARGRSRRNPRSPPRGDDRGGLDPRGLGAASSRPSAAASLATASSRARRRGRRRRRRRRRRVALVSPGASSALPFARRFFFVGDALLRALRRSVRHRDRDGVELRRQERGGHHHRRREGRRESASAPKRPA